MSELLEQMKLLNEDHKPDGWPAVRMSEINELIEIIEKKSEQLAKANERLKELDIERQLLISEIEPLLDMQEGGEYYTRTSIADDIYEKFIESSSLDALNKFAIENQVKGVNWFSEKYCDDEHSFLADKAVEQLRKEQEHG